jgi:hypothetical protein
VAVCSVFHLCRYIPKLIKSQTNDFEKQTMVQKTERNKQAGSEQIYEIPINKKGAQKSPS